MPAASQLQQQLAQPGDKLVLMAVARKRQVMQLGLDPGQDQGSLDMGANAAGDADDPLWPVLLAANAATPQAASSR